MKTHLLYAILFVLIFSNNLFAQPGTPDKTFGDKGIAKFYVPLDNGAYATSPDKIVQRKNGKYLAVVYSYHGSYGRSAYLYQLTNKGKIDSAFFGVNGRVALYTGDDRCDIGNLALDSSGNILITSGLTDFSYDRFTIMRFKHNGKPDVSFGDSGVISLQKGTFLQPQKKSLNVLPNGKILLAANTSNGTSKSAMSILYRFNENGTPDSSFNGKGYKEVTDHSLFSTKPLALQSNRKFIFAQQQIHRFNGNGSLIFNFGTNGVIKGDSIYTHNTLYRETFSNLQTLKSGGFMCTGNLQIPGNEGLITNTDKIYKFTKEGKPDTTFNAGGVLVIDSNYSTDMQPVSMLVIQPDSKFLIDSASFNSDFPETITRYKKNGKIDNAFGEDGRIYVTDFISDIYLDNDSKILLPLQNFANSHPDSVFIERFNNNVQALEPSLTPENVITKNNSSIKVSPNPVQSILNITGLKSNVKLSIINELGKPVAEAFTSSNYYNWNIQNLSAGNYFLVASQNNQIIATIKLIKQ